VKNKLKFASHKSKPLLHSVKWKAASDYWNKTGGFPLNSKTLCIMEFKTQKGRKCILYLLVKYSACCKSENFWHML